MKQTVLVILIFPLVLFAQTPRTYQETIETLMKTESGIDSVFAEQELNKINKDRHVVSSSNRHQHDTTLKLEYHEIKINERSYIPLGYRISTYKEGESITTYYFNKEGFIESKVTFNSGQPVRVDIFNEDFELAYYLKFENDKWLTFRPEGYWKPVDEQWKSFEMIKSMILKR